MRTNVDSLGFAGAAGVTLNYRTGNTEFLDYGISGRVDFRTEFMLLFVIADYRLISKDHDAFSKRGFYHARLNTPLSEETTLEIFAQEENNRSTNLLQRWLIGAGVRYAVFETSDTHLHSGTAYMYEFEELSSWVRGVDEPEIYSHRWSNYLVFRASIDDRTAFFNAVYYQPRFDSFGDFRLLEEANLVFQLGKLFAFRNALTIRHDSRPPAGIEQTDIVLETGITLHF